MQNHSIVHSNSHLRTAKGPDRNFIAAVYCFVIPLELCKRWERRLLKLQETFIAGYMKYK